MKLLLDQGLARSTVSLLTRHGHDAVHVSDLGMATATDTAILDEAQKQLRTVVTLDADFHALLALRGATTPSVIRLRVQGKKASYGGAEPRDQGAPSWQALPTLPSRRSRLAPKTCARPVPRLERAPPSRGRPRSCASTHAITRPADDAFKTHLTVRSRVTHS